MSNKWLKFDIQLSKPDGSGALSSYRDPVRISSKVGDVLLDPPQSHQLVLEPLIAGDVIPPLQGQEAHGTQPVVDGHQDDPGLQEVVRPSAQVSRTQSEASAVDPEQDRLELEVVSAVDTEGDAGGVDTQVKTVQATHNLKWISIKEARLHAEGHSLICSINLNVEIKIYGNL